MSLKGRERERRGVQEKVYKWIRGGGSQSWYILYLPFNTECAFVCLIGNWKWIFRHILKLPHVEGALFRRWKWAFGLPSHCILVDFGRGGSGIKHVGSASTDFYHHRPHSNPSPLPYHHTRSDQAGVKWANFLTTFPLWNTFLDLRSKIDCWEWKSDDWFSFVCHICRWICWM